MMMLMYNVSKNCAFFLQTFCSFQYLLSIIAFQSQWFWKKWEINEYFCFLQINLAKFCTNSYSMTVHFVLQIYLFLFFNLLYLLLINVSSWSLLTFISFCFLKYAISKFSPCSYAILDHVSFFQSSIIPIFFFHIILISNINFFFFLI